MADAATIEMNESQARQLENLIDETLRALENLENNSQARDRRIEESQRRTDKVLDHTETVLTEIAALNANRRNFTTMFSQE